MAAVLCPTCGCSLVRVRVSRAKAAHMLHDGASYSFCCERCAELFRCGPERYGAFRSLLASLMVPSLA